MPNLKTSRIQPTEEMSRVQAIKIIMLAVSTHTSRDLRERGPAAKLRWENGANIHGISLYLSFTQKENFQSKEREFNPMTFFKIFPGIG